MVICKVVNKQCVSANSQGLIIESFSLVLQYNNTIQTDMGLFDKLDEEYAIEHEPKYESFEFIESDKFTTLQEYVLNRKKD